MLHFILTCCANAVHLYVCLPLRYIYNICKHVIDIRLRPNIPLNLRQSFSFGRSCNFYIRSTTNDQCFGREAQCGWRTTNNWTKTAYRTHG